MDFRQLQYMLKVAEEKSFSKAAQKLYIAQPSLSQYIQKMEQQLGVQLFDRTNNPITLTYAGELYIETAKKILDLKNQLIQQMEDIVELKKGCLKIGVASFRSTYFIPKVLPLFYERFPGIEVILFEGTSGELEELALKGTTDITIMMMPVPKELFSYEIILKEEILLAVPPKHPLSKKEGNKINLAALKNESFILLKQNQKLHQIAVNLCKQVGFKPKILLETESIETAHALVAAGMGISFIPDILLLANTYSKQPKYFSIEDFSATREMVVAYRKGRYLSTASKEFINVMKEALS
ncbi:LysR family transcriptional regulator [Clostridium sp. YIM B02515]|uniref:LysR family transcriptional regulator n=1 Tax=Clostridium rhizosphaerae TaxID=2803861 RepID=A0ABS1THY6_9CLOT|nr:LysR family transcriptional regulator [Clostridium rhizosphaerae]MBL4938226.1 LysR family transcriptional regulator [Clostridium rhizosphaerae]